VVKWPPLASEISPLPVPIKTEPATPLDADAQIAVVGQAEWEPV